MTSLFSKSNIFIWNLKDNNISTNWIKRVGRDSKNSEVILEYILSILFAMNGWTSESHITSVITCKISPNIEAIIDSYSLSFNKNIKSKGVINIYIKRLSSRDTLSRKNKDNAADVMAYIKSLIKFFLSSLKKENLPIARMLSIPMKNDSGKLINIKQKYEPN